MERDQHYHHHRPPHATGKVKMLEEPPSDDLDERLSALGYNIKSSDMTDVARNLEQLEEAMFNNAQESQLASSETVHYNPSDLSTWVETMLNELNPVQGFTNNHQNHFFYSNPGNVNHQNQIFDATHQNKRVKLPNQCHDLHKVSNFSRSVVLVDYDDGLQESGIRLVHALMSCAEAIQQNNLTLAEAFLKQIGVLASSQTGSMRKVATYFAEALARRIYKLNSKDLVEDSLASLLQIHFYETCPYLKFAHFTANQAILEAFEGKKRVHVIDFSMNQGMQWPALMQALALRPGGPPVFRLTGIGQPSSDNYDHLQEVGWKLAQLAETMNVEFEFRGFVANSLADLDESMLELRSCETESFAVNAVFELHKLLALPGAMEKVLSMIKEMKPEILTIVEQEVNLNGPGFVDRFSESLHYYSTLFDSLEGSSVNGKDKVMSEVYLGKQICNVVACEGVDRVERHETLTQWRNRLDSSGFVPAPLGSNAFKQASMLLSLFDGGDWYKLEENGGCLMLGWHTRSLITTSAWKVGS
ncbi:hypothetical protein ACFE04_030265 [Oxalis oulophora]